MIRRMKRERRLTREEKRIIRDCAKRSAGFGTVEICPSTKCNLNADRGTSMNIWLVTDDPNYRDVDLADNAFSWDETRVEFTADGRCAIDFYVYGPIGPNKELQTNVTAFWESGELSYVKGTLAPNLWVRS